MALDAHIKGHLGRPDVGRIDEYLGHRKPTAFGVKIIDREGSDFQWKARVITLVE